MNNNTLNLFELDPIVNTMYERILISNERGRERERRTHWQNEDSEKNALRILKKRENTF